jgi:hypothetical protein
MRMEEVRASLRPAGDLLLRILRRALDETSPVQVVKITFGDGVLVQFLVNHEVHESWEYNNSGWPQSESELCIPVSWAAWRAAFDDLDKFRKTIVACFRDRLTGTVLECQDGFSGKLVMRWRNEGMNSIDEVLERRLTLEDRDGAITVWFRPVEPPAAEGVHRG